MQFRATVRPRSFLWRLWTSERRIGGTISGVQFRKVGTEFVSVDDPLPPDDVATLAHNNMVVLEISALPVGQVVQEPVKVIQPKADPAPTLAPTPEPTPAVDLRAPQPAKADLRVPQKGWPAGGNSGGGKRR